MFYDFIEYSNLTTKLIFVFLIFLSVFHLFSYKNNFFSFEHFFFLIFIFLPLIFFIPFSFDSLNSIASPPFLTYRNLLNDVVVINFLGICSYLIGVYLSKNLSFGSTFFAKTSYYFWEGINNKYFSALYIFLGLSLLVFMTLSMGISLGGGRNFAMDNPSIRPFILLYMSLINILIYYTFAYFYVKKNYFNLIKIIILLLLSLFSGTRSALIAPIIFCIFMYYHSFNLKINLKNFFKLIFVVFSCILGLQFVVYLRSNDDFLSESTNAGLISLFYGNTFSDIRDFAWVLSNWNNEFLLGKTQISGFMSFIPSYLSPFRQEWSWGRYSTMNAGLNSDDHPGLRPGFFGEMYLNFGLIGVIVLGLIVGVIIGRFNSIIISLSNDINKTIRYYVFGSVLFAVIYNFAITSAFFKTYIILILFIFYILAVSIFNKLPKKM